MTRSCPVSEHTEHDTIDDNAPQLGRGQGGRYPIIRDRGEDGYRYSACLHLYVIDWNPLDSMYTTLELEESVAARQIRSEVAQL